MNFPCESLRFEDLLSLQYLVYYYDTLTQTLHHGFIHLHHKYFEYNTISGTVLDTEVLMVNKSRLFSCNCGTQSGMTMHHDDVLPLLSLPLSF